MKTDLTKILCWTGLVGTMAAFYITLDKAEKMNRVNPTNDVVFCYKTVQPTNEVSATNTSYKN